MYVPDMMSRFLNCNGMNSQKSSEAVGVKALSRGQAMLLTSLQRNQGNY